MGFMLALELSTCPDEVFSVTCSMSPFSWGYVQVVSLTAVLHETRGAPLDQT